VTDLDSPGEASAGRDRPPRLFVFGWDGADWAVIDEGWRRGKIGNLRALAERGQKGVLRSTHPPLTPTAWTSFITGVDPGVHGIFGFISVDRGDYRMRLIPGGARRVSTLMAGLDRAGYRTVTVTVPWTYPAERLEHGAEVPGWDAPDETFDSSHPPELARELAAQIPRVPRKTSLRLVNVKPSVVLETQAEKIDLKERICDLLVDRVQPDVFMMVFTEPDSAGHLLWTRGPVPDGLVDAYDQVDRAMGRMIDRYVGEDDTVLVVSDHGTKPFHTYIHLGVLLAEGGFLTPEAAGQRHGAVATVKREVWTRLPIAARTAIARNLPDRVRRAGDRSKRPGRVDWARTQAFPVGTELVSLGVAVNLESRYAHGVVPDDHYAELRRRVAAHLEATVDPKDGTRVFERAVDREDMYAGDALDDAPDLVLRLTDGYGARSGLNVHRPLSRVAFGGHREEGIFVASAPLGLGASEPIHAVFPKVLTRLGYPAVTGAAPSAAPEGYSPEEAEEIEARLRDLGYME
jgi:predicted AlkP superfamily phosphohydrolase/phosphomutase